MADRQTPTSHELFVAAKLRTTPDELPALLAQMKGRQSYRKFAEMLTGLGIPVHFNWLRRYFIRHGLQEVKPRQTADQEEQAPK